MTTIDDLISIHGENYSVNRVSSGAVDGYGDPAPTWSVATTEKVWLQDLSVKRLNILESSIGRLDVGEYVAFLLSTSVIVQGDVLTCVSTSIRYDVRRIFTEKLFNTASHKVAVLRQSEDT